MDRDGRRCFPEEATFASAVQAVADPLLMERLTATGQAA
jgi:hypothetical protein